DLEEPRRSMGDLLTHGIRFGRAADVLTAGEGTETMLALRSLLPDMPMLAATSAAHLAVIALPPGLKRLYIARDNDAAGRIAVARLTERAEAAAVEVRPLVPICDDWNTDLIRQGPTVVLARLVAQLAPEDVPTGFANAVGMPPMALPAR